MRISLRAPQIFRTDPDPVGQAGRFRLRGGVAETAARVWAFAVMAGVVITLHVHGADLVTASGVVVALGAAATQLTIAPLTLAKASSAAPGVS